MKNYQYRSGPDRGFRRDGGNTAQRKGTANAHNYADNSLNKQVVRDSQKATTNARDCKVQRRLLRSFNGKLVRR